jgi:hypothetical protein
MYACPWCGQKTFTFWQKQTLGPMRTMRCSSCKRQVSLSMFRAQVAGAPLIALGLLGMTVGKVVFASLAAILLGAWVGLTIGLLITVPLYHWFVPLEKQTA